MTRKKHVPIPIRCLALVLSVALLSVLLPIPTANAAMLIIGTDLQDSGGSVMMYVAFMYGSQPEQTVYQFTLQQKVGGTWVDYSSYGGIMNEYHKDFTYYLSPPKGYTYRIKVTASSASMSGVEQYSRLLSY